MTTDIRSRISRIVEATVIIGYSIFVLLSRSPVLGDVSNFLTLAYFIFVPGYAITSLLAEEYDILSRLFYSVLVGLAVLLSLSALEKDAFLSLSTNYILTIPIIAVLVEGYVYYFKKSA